MTMKHRICLLGILTAALATMRVSAQTGGNEVIVIYNTAVPESKAVADYYAKQRAVPTRQLFGFKLSTGSDMSRAEYRDLLLNPLVSALTNAGLVKFGDAPSAGTNAAAATPERRVVEATIRYAVLCYGVPWRIKPDAGLYEPEAETIRPELRRNEAAVDAELACLPLSQRPYHLVGPLGNPFYATTNAHAIHPTNGLLIVTRLDGPSPEIARGLVDKALEAERDGLWGRAYVDLRGNVEPGLREGEQWLANAAELCRRRGYETLVDTNGDVFPPSYPMSQIAFYAGWYREHVCGPFAATQVEFMPGAFAYHLHSFSAANLHSATQQWVGPLLARGATITMGTVHEPYVAGTPDIGTFAVGLLGQGFSFGEAAYSAQQVLSWQTTVVGDPLYRPLGRPLQDLHNDLDRRQSPLLTWSQLNLANVNLVNRVPMADVVELLEGVTRDAIIAEKLGDLYAAQGKPSSSAHAYAQALKLSPSPQQRVRLTLGLVEKLVGLGREAEAYDLLRDFLPRTPDYADKPGIYRRLLDLAKRLGKTEEAGKLERILSALSPSSPSTNNAAK